MKSLIVSDSLQHSQLVARAVGLEWNEWRHVRNVFDMFGYYGATIYVYDTIEWRKDYADIANQIAMLTAVGKSDVVVIDEWFIGGPTKEDREAAQWRTKWQPGSNEYPISSPQEPFPFIQ